jgi:hypothetical protein
MKSAHQESPQESAGLEIPLETVPLETVPVAPGAPLLRPMTMGELLDRALQIFRANFGRLFAVTLVFQTPMYALQELFSQFMLQKAPALARPGAYGGIAPADQLGWFFVGLAALVPPLLVLHQLATAALAGGGARGLLGERVEFGRALRETLARTPQVVGTSVLLLLWVGLLLLLCALPGAGLFAISFALDATAARVASAIAGLLAFFGVPLVVGLYLTLRYALVVEVVMIEKLSMVAALRRSARLMAGRVGPTALDGCKLRASIVYLVSFCISASVAVVASLPSMLVYTAFDVSPFNPELFDPAAVPFWAMLPVKLFALLCQSAVAPYGILASIAFYFDLRVKREAFDLELMAGRVEAAR